METIKCEACGRELPLSEFSITKGGGRCSTCRECVNEKQAQTRYEHRREGGADSLPFPTRTSTI